MIRKGAVSDFLGRKLDDWRWMKGLSREEILQEIQHLRLPPQFKMEPWDHQLVCFYIGMLEPRFMFLLDMGLGKTALLLMIISQLKLEGRLTRALITVPRVINMSSWAEDIARHSNLTAWKCDVPNSAEKLERLTNPQGDITIIDYAGLHLAVSSKLPVGGKFKLVKDEKKMRELLRHYNFLGIDESHKLSNHQSLWYSIIKQIARRVDYCYGITGTLFNHNPEAAWAQFNIVDGGETLGDTLGLFRSTFFEEKSDRWKGTTYVFKKSMTPVLHKMMQHRSIRYDEDEVLDLPKRVHRSQYFEMADDQRQHYLQAVQGLLDAKGKLRDLEAPWIRMRQICSGYLAWKDETGPHLVYFAKNPKLDGVERLIDEMGDSKVVIAYDYTPTGAMLVERIKSMRVGYEWFYGGTKDKEGSRHHFMTDPKCKVFVMNSSAGGTGNDGLQKVAKYMILYESPSSPTERKQVIKRIHRPGQEHRTYIYDLTYKGTVESGILDSIKEGTDLYNKVVNGAVSRDTLLGF